MLANTTTGFPTNPRGWFNDPTVDVTTPQGIASFQQRVLQYARYSASVLQGMNAQGMITWDIEGEQYPQPTTYICDPTQLTTLAPEMAGVVDQYFQTFVQAGLRVGVCIRPQQLVILPDGTPSQTVVSDPNQIAQLMIAKVNYAKQHWGATLFYVDSNVVSYSDGNPLPVSIFQTLQATFPDSLFIPEHSTPDYWNYTAPYLELDQGHLGTPSDVRALYPHAFTVLNVENGPLAQDYSGVAASVQAGDLLLFRAWFDDEPTNGLVRNLYGFVPPSGIAVSPSTASLTANQTVQLTAIGAAGPQATWQVLNGGAGTVSGSGLYTAPSSIASQQQVAVMATSVANPAQTAVSLITLNPNLPAIASPIYVNSGGGAYVDTAGRSWIADAFFEGGASYSTGASEANTPDPALYQDVHYGDFSYNFAVPNGSYAVTLKFSEIFFNSPGERVFNVAINGQLVLTNFDIVAASGGENVAYDQTFTVPVSNQQIQIQFTGVVNDASVSAVAVVPFPAQPVVISVNPASASLSAGQTAQFNASVSGTTNTAVIWSILNNGPGTLSAAGLYTAPGSISTQQTVTIEAISSADTSKTATATITLTPAPPVNPPPAPSSGMILINSGGGVVVDSLGQTWSADTGYSGGATYGAPMNVGNTSSPALYQDVRYGNFSYALSVPNGNYTVTLKFAEIYFTSAGQRVFNVAIDGQTVLSNFDIAAAAGGAGLAVDRSFPVNTQNGQIQIQFTSVVNNAMVNAIEIAPASAPPATAVALINSGGGAYTDSLGRTWSADTAYSGGNPYSTSGAVANTSDSQLYQDVRYGNFSYTLAVPTGTRTVTLKFAEIYFTQPGQRVFSVAINGTTVLSNFDIAAAAGPNVALDKSFTVPATNGQVVITFTSIVDNAMVNAIEID